MEKRVLAIGIEICPLCDGTLLGGNDAKPSARFW